MSNGKWLVIAAIGLSAAAGAQTIDELAAAARAKQAAELAEQKMKNDSIENATKLASPKPIQVAPSLPKAQVNFEPLPKYQLHSVITRSGSTFGEVAIQDRLVRADVNTKFGSSTVTGITQQGIVLKQVDYQCLARKSKHDAEMAKRKRTSKKTAAVEQFYCGDLNRFIAVGGYF